RSPRCARSPAPRRRAADAGNRPAWPSGAPAAPAAVGRGGRGFSVSLPFVESFDLQARHRQLPDAGGDGLPAGLRGVQHPALAPLLEIDADVPRPGLVAAAHQHYTALCGRLDSPAVIALDLRDQLRGLADAGGA